MSENIIANFLQRSKMEELLYDLSLGILEANEQRLSEEDIERICERGYAFKLGDHHLIGRNYLRKHILDSLKKNEQIDKHLSIKSYNISPFLVTQLLNDLVLEGIAKKEKNHFIPNFDILISKEAVSKVCQYKIDPLTVQAITKILGFQSIVSKYIPDFPKKPEYEQKVYSGAYEHCQAVVNQLVEEGTLVKDSHTDDIFYWNSARQ